MWDRGSVFRKGSRPSFILKGRDGTAEVRLTFFNMPYLRQSTTAGSPFCLPGYAASGPGRKPKIWNSPDFGEAGKYRDHVSEPCSRDIRASRDRREPNARVFCRLRSKRQTGLKDFLPLHPIKKYGLMGQIEAVSRIHFPTDRDNRAESQAEDYF